MARNARKRRKRTDWVSNQFTYNPFTDQYAITGGDGVIGIPLTFSDKSRVLLTGEVNTSLLETFRSSWTAVPEGNRGTVLAVRGQIQVRSQVPWIENNRMEIAFRLAVHEQDPLTMGAITPLQYQLGLNPLPGAFAAYNEANERFLWETKVCKGFSAAASENGDSMLMLNWSGKRTLRPDQALFLMVEVGTNANDVFFSTWLRTLMEVGE